ncbi:hypothetical protein MBLNU230_g2315t1 [Neophaeotheca triangularis]
MHLSTTLVATTTLLTTALAQATVNTTGTRTYYLRTCVRDGQEDKAQFDNLYLQSYHTGAGLGDATLSTSNSSEAAIGYLTPLNITSDDGTPLSQQNLDLGNPFPWTLLPQPNTVAYTQWQPVRINAAGSRATLANTGFYIDEETGLQWAFEGFAGWRVCEWWHGVPQLFFNVPGFSGSEPSEPESCADVDLMPEYI